MNFDLLRSFEAILPGWECCDVNSLIELGSWGVTLLKRDLSLCRKISTWKKCLKQRAVSIFDNSSFTWYRRKWELMQYRKVEVQTSHIVHETEVISTQRVKTSANIQGKVLGGERKTSKLLWENIWKEIIYGTLKLFSDWQCFPFWLVPFFITRQYLSLQCSNIQCIVQDINLNVDFFPSVAVFETTFSIMWVMYDGFQTTRLDLKKLSEIQ